jgi:hypothetical protein
VGLKIALCGAALLLIGAALGTQFRLETAASAGGTAKSAREIVPLVPSTAGALLTFLGAIRISLTTRPLRLVVLGLILVVVAIAIPFALAQLFPEMRTYKWTLSFLLPLVTRWIIGLTCFSTALWRLVMSTRKRT